MSLRLAYVTNGLTGHRLEDALRFLAESGYDGVALTLDHLHFDPYAPAMPARAARLRALLVRGVHEHLDFGEGELDVGAALGALTEVGFRGLVAVELSRHAHAAHETVPRAIAHLRAHEPAAAAVPS